MVKYIKRTTDNKYLQSVQDDIWVDNVKDASIMTYRECETVKETLSNSYTKEQLKEVVDFSKSKPISKEEEKELIDLLKNK